MDEVDEIGVVTTAISAMYYNDSSWTTNYVKWRRMDTTARTRWWRLAKKQAELGAPAMQTLLAKVIELRMKL